MIVTKRRYRAAAAALAMLSAVGPVGAQMGGINERALKGRLAYLKSEPDVAWVKVVKNRVHIGWARQPTDPPLAVRAGEAAVSGSQTIGAAVHVLNYRASEFPTPTGGPGDFCRATARFGRLASNDC